MKTVKQYLFKKKVLVLLFVVLMLAIVSVSLRTNRQERISEFGKYQGYSEEIYDGTQRTSDYLMLSDGTRLAYDLIISSKNGMPADKPLPVLLSYTPYGRTWTIFDENGKFLVNEFVDTKTKILARLRYWISGDKGWIMDPLFLDAPVVMYQFKWISVEVYNFSFLVPLIVLAVIFERLRRAAREPKDDLSGNEVVYWQRQDAG